MRHTLPSSLFIACLSRSLAACYLPQSCALAPCVVVWGVGAVLAQDQGVSPLYISCQNGHEDIAALLLHGGAAVDFKTVRCLLLRCQVGVGLGYMDSCFGGLGVWLAGLRLHSLVRRCL